ncbi:hypothetical protein Pmani_039891, partial [Petrolisthes manimaculis]
KQSTVPARVVLHKVGFNSSGQYRCEVSAEAPDFNTVNCRGSLMVVEPPADGPVITGGRTKYHVNDTVDLVCTSSPSRPPSRLSWLINGRQARPEFVTKERPYMGKDGLMTQISRLVFVTRPSHFHGGKLKIKCVADITGETLAKHSAFSHSFKQWERLFLDSYRPRELRTSYSFVQTQNGLVGMNRREFQHMQDSKGLIQTPESHKKLKTDSPWPRFASPGVAGRE